MSAGIYVIEINGMYYVGSTSDFEKRFKTHIDLLSKK
jgi:predicted GIY-YIG superfamily endonuclease